MKRNRINRGLLLIFIVLNITTMQAQNTPEKTPSSLNDQQQNLSAIAALTATGNTDQLKLLLNSGLDSGLTVNEIKEALVQLYAYCGFPRSLNAITVFKTILDERAAKGIKDKEGKIIIVKNKNADKYEQGRKVLEELTKTPQPKPAPGFGEFAPRVDVFLKEHLFADIFNSDVLSFQQRELVTISALAAMSGVEPQLKSHILMGNNTGISEEQLNEVCKIIETNVNRQQANILRKAINRPELPIIDQDMLIRISEIEIFPEMLSQYKAILKTESAASVKLEPGVIAIYPMFQKENSTQFRIVEIYANKKAYEGHLQTPHFKLYKESTLKMVKSLKLVDMEALDPETMPLLFDKLK